MMNNNTTADLASSWIDVDSHQLEPDNEGCVKMQLCNTGGGGAMKARWCPLPIFTPKTRAPDPPAMMVARTIVEMRQGLQHHSDDITPLPELHRSLKDSEIKTELHRILQSIQCSSDYGVYFCESFRDPRRHYIDDYWPEVSHEAFGIEELHHTVGKVNNSPLPEQARARLHEFARLLDRLARRIDRVVLA